MDISSDVTGDGLVDFVLGGDVIRAADGVSLNVGALLVYPGPIYADAAEHTLGQAPAVLLGGLPGDFIDTVCAVGDVDGDGYEDLVASGTSGGDPPVGVAYLVRGPVVGTIDLAASAQRFDGEWFGAALGTCAGPGDLDGDGLNDIVLGSSGVSGGSSGHPGGQVYLLHGPVSETRASDTPDMLAGTDKLMEYLGYSVAVLGDLSGDGLLDYGVTNWGGPAPDGVAAYLVTELPDGVAHPRDVGVTVQYDKSGLGFLNNMIINKVGDITGDGYDDVGFGASDGPQSNLIATLSGPFGGDALLDLTTEWDTLLLSDAIDSYASFAAGLGDWNGDGHEDLAVGDPHFATKARMRTGACDANPADCYMGAVFLLAGPIAAGSIDLHADADRLEGTYSTGELGRALGGGGDINSDGFPDLAVGAPHGNDGTHEGTGIAYVLFGGGSP